MTGLLTADQLAEIRSIHADSPTEQDIDAAGIKEPWASVLDVEGYRTVAGGDL